MEWNGLEYEKAKQNFSHTDINILTVTVFLTKTQV